MAYSNSQWYLRPLHCLLGATQRPRHFMTAVPCDVINIVCNSDVTSVAGGSLGFVHAVLMALAGTVCHGMTTTARLEKVWCMNTCKPASATSSSLAAVAIAARNCFFSTSWQDYTHQRFLFWPWGLVLSCRVSDTKAHLPWHSIRNIDSKFPRTLHQPTNNMELWHWSQKMYCCSRSRDSVLTSV